MAQNKQEKFKYIDLFAGCGGFSLGLFNSQRWKGLFAIEKSADAFKTLEHNLISRNQHFEWPKWLGVGEHDIKVVLKKHRRHLEALAGDVDLIAGGPPCQGFSLAGRRLEGDERNALVHSYLDFTAMVRPRMILFENVKGFKIGFKNEDDTRGIPYSELVLDRLRELGYGDATAKVINFSEYGVPQERKRCIIFATRIGLAEEFFESLTREIPRFLLRKGLHPRQDLGSAISDLQRSYGTVPSLDTKNFEAGVYADQPQSSYQELMRRNASISPDSHRFANHAPATESKFHTIIMHRLRSREVQERFGTRKTSTKLLSKDVPAPTLTTLPDDYVHYCEPRILTVREYARIQSFPDWYQIKGKYTTGGQRRVLDVPRYTQVGNAIPPLFAELSGIVAHRMAKVSREHYRVESS